MTMSLVQRRLIILILALLFLGTAISDLHPALAGKKVKSLSAEQREVSAGSSVEATVKINKPAPSKGGVVYLSSGDPSTAKVPESVVIRPGESSALFVIDTTESPNSSSIVISALYGNKSKKLTVTVNGVTPRAIRLSSLTLAPTSVPRGASAQGTVTINSPAPSGGVSVALSNGNPSAISMPASLVIPAGSSQASFTIASSLVSTSTTASLSAIYEGTKKTALLNISADFAALSSISVNPIVVAGGSSSQGTVSLSVPAGFAGAVVPLSSNSSAATVPASVTVPAGAATGVFTVTTSAVFDSTPVTISASYGSVTRTAQLTVEPAIAGGLSSLVLNPSSITGSSPSQATVNLGGPAGPGGVLVALSTNSAVASAPASVVIAPGSTSAAFTVNTSLVAVPTAVSVSAVYGGVTRAATLTVLPISSTLSSISVSPSTVTGGAASQGTVTLNGAAPVGDAIITLSTNKSSTAAPPASVTVPAGFSSTTFMISTSEVSIVTGVTISAVYGSRTRTANLSVQPGVAETALSSLEVNPASVIGGTSSRGTVTLTDKASSGDIVVALSSNNPAATPPASVLVPAGSASATFTIATTQVTNTTSVSISANYFGVTKSAPLSVDPIPSALSSVSLNPTSVVGGNASQGTVILSSPAPPGGAVVSLSKNNSAATLPANVTVTAGATSAIFTINTTTVTSSRSITVSAVYSGVTRTATLTVDPVASALSSVALSPTTVVGGSSSQGTVTLSTAAPAGGAVVSLSSNNSAATVPATVTVPASATSVTFTVNTTSVVSTRSITITGVYTGVTRNATLTVDPVPSALSSIALTPTSVFGGTSAQGSVLLSTAAPSGGALISLSSNNPAGTVPASVTVTAGSTSATFTINTTSVSSSRSVTISGVYTGVTRTATLTVDPIPATLSSLSLNPTSVVGGSSFQGTVTLSAGAPAGGALISLSSNNAAATVPTSVTIAAGASSATFTVNTTTVSSSRSVTISAVYNGVTRTASLTVDLVPAALSTVALNPTSVVGGSSSQGTITVSSVAPAGGAVVSLSSNNSAATVPASVTVAAGSSTATFTVNTTSVTSSRSVTISAVYSGFTRTASLSVNPVAAALSSVALNPTSVVGGNSSQGTVTLTVAAPTGGAVVSLSSNNASATVPATVTVPAGSTSRTFTVNTTSVTSTRSVTVSAVYGGVTRTASLYVDPVAPALTSLVLNPTSVIGSSPSQGTATLTAAAPPGGSVVSLSSTNPAVATVVTSVLVPGGSTSATFPVPTSVVFSTSTVTISGSCGGGIGGSSLTVQPLAADTTPPVISAVTSSVITASGASLSWTTNEASNTQVEYGTTTSYGSSTVLNTTMVVAHSVILSGLSANTTYNYRVRSRDVAGNLATSSNFTFRTTAGVPPPPTGCPGFVIDGFGKDTTGGCGGTVYTVTNRNDSGPGSFRNAVMGTGSRIVKFAVSGDIVLADHIEITNGNLTIDGGDAPNGGICIRGDSVFFRASNIIVRYVRFRIGPTPDSSPRGDRDNVALQAQAGQTMSNLVFDHCSFSWADDGNFDIVNGVRDLTVQWCIFSENFGPGHMLLGSGGICAGGGATRITVHHNLFAQGGRNPEITTGDIDWVNNVVFRDFDGRNYFGLGNHLYFAALSYTGSWNSPFSRVNWVGNYFRPGNREMADATHQQIRVNGDSGGCGGVESVYAKGNIGPSRPIDSLPERDILYDNSQGTANIVGTRFPYPQVTTTSAAQAYTEVLASAGATRPFRDAVDTRIVSVVATGAGVITPWMGETNPASVGGWPDLTQPFGSLSLELDANVTSDGFGEAEPGVSSSEASSSAVTSHPGIIGHEGVDLLDFAIYGFDSANGIASRDVSSILEAKSATSRRLWQRRSPLSGFDFDVNHRDLIRGLTREFDNKVKYSQP